MKQYALSIGVLFVGLALIGGGCATSNVTNDVSVPTEMTDTDPTMTDVEVVVSTLAPGVYTIATDASTVEWYGNKIVGGSHTGTVALKEGQVTVDENGNLSSGNFVIDMTTIEGAEGEPQMVITHLKSDDFFAVEQHNEASFALKSGERQEDGTYLVVGDLTIKGITNEITFGAAVTQDTPATVSANATFEIDRTRWDVRYGSGAFFEDLGDNVINDNMKFTLTIVANNADAAEVATEDAMMEGEVDGDIQIEVLGTEADANLQIEVVQ